MRPFRASKIPMPPQLPHTAEWMRFSHLDLEIGAGTGLFAQSYCSQNPSRALIALEKTFTRSGQLLARQKDLTNLFAYQTDAAAFITHFIADQSLERVFILYPNPYPKAKQANLRWHNRPFMSCLLGKLKAGGTLELATNIESYYQEASEVFARDWKMKTLEAREVMPSPTPRTLFEKKYLARGERCWNLVLQKVTPN